MTTFTTLYPCCLLSAILVIFFNLPCKVIAQQGRPKILALHGGGGTGSSFAYETNQLAGALPEYEFIYADAGYSCGSGCKLWISDPPGGKGQPTTDPAFSDDSIHALDQILENQGPFVGILGYSQGAAYVPVYLSRVPEGTFSFAVMFCGYLTETHQGILDVVEEQSPFGDIPALVWMGVNDFIISNAQTTNQAGIFTSPTVITDNNAGHVVPGTSESTFTDVVSFISSFSASSPTPTSSPNGTTSSSPSASPGGCVDYNNRISLLKNGNRITRNCEWVSNKKTQTRCNYTGVSAACPVTCGSCSTCVDPDPSIKFKFLNGGRFIKRNCEWVARKQTSLRCSLTNNVCRATCGAC